MVDSRIPSEPDYVQTLGQALYNFSYMEWGVINIIVRLSPEAFNGIPIERTGAEIAKTFYKRIATANPSLPESLHSKVLDVANRYADAAILMNELLHAHPYTTEAGHQELGGKMEWGMEKLESAIKSFDEISILNSGLLYGELAEPWGKGHKKF